MPSKPGRTVFNICCVTGGTLWALKRNSSEHWPSDGADVVRLPLMWYKYYGSRLRREWVSVCQLPMVSVSEQEDHTVEKQLAC